VRSFTALTCGLCVSVTTSSDRGNVVRHLPKLITLIILMTFGSVVAGMLLSPFVHPAVIAGLLIVVCGFLVFRHTRTGSE
jgi:hypothetical protein